MKAIAVTPEQALHDISMPRPQYGARDLLVEVHAIAVNPVDIKQRKVPLAPGRPRILGWDACGVVVEKGPGVSLFHRGDRVYFAGSMLRDGAYGEYTVVDERIAAHAPSTLRPPEAAALPLTSITAWEALFTRLDISRDGRDRGRTLLVVGGAGGVGSIAIQLARQLAGVTVVATASRPESAEWCRALGAHHVIDHAGDMPAQLRDLELGFVDFILCTNDLDRHLVALAEAIAPQGRICSIVRNERLPLPTMMFMKSVTFSYELMFTRAMYETADMAEQHRLLTEVAKLVDDGTLRTTFNSHYGTIGAANLTRAHAAIEGGRTIGKIVLAGW